MSTKLPNPFEYAKDPELNMMFDKMVSLRDRVSQQFEKANSIAGLNGDAKFLPLEQVKINLPSFESLREPNNSWRYGGKVSLDVVKKQAEDAIVAARAEIARVEALNAENVKNNDTLVQQVKDLMTRLGFSEIYTTYEFPSSRSRNRKEVRHTAGYITDLHRVRPTSNTDAMTRSVNDYESRLAYFLTRAKELEDKEKADSDAKAFEEIVNKQPGLVEFLMECKINIMTRLASAKAGTKRGVVKEALNEVLEDVLSQDKYLHLAYYLECNRNDWNDGYSFAEQGLNGFSIKNDVDQAIYDEINSHIEDWDGDGRVFRDCEWNYSRLYGMVENAELADRLQKVTNYLSSF